jgi:hypothetical protein
MTTLNKMLCISGYSHYILPYEAGLALMKSLMSAEKLEKHYDESQVEILPVSKEDWSFHPFSQKQYDDIKSAMFLGITYREYKENANKRSEESS